jgi:hypothetical protein
MDTVHPSRSIRARTVYLIPLYSTGSPLRVIVLLRRPRTSDHILAPNWLAKGKGLARSQLAMDDNALRLASDHAAQAEQLVSKQKAQLANAAATTKQNKSKIIRTARRPSPKPVNRTPNEMSTGCPARTHLKPHASRLSLHAAGKYALSEAAGEVRQSPKYSNENNGRGRGNMNITYGLRRALQVNPQGIQIRTAPLRRTTQPTSPITLRLYRALIAIRHASPRLAMLDSLAPEGDRPAIEQSAHVPPCVRHVRRVSRRS